MLLCPTELSEDESSRARQLTNYYFPCLFDADDGYQVEFLCLRYAGCQKISFILSNRPKAVRGLVFLFEKETMYRVQIHVTGQVPNAKLYLEHDGAQCSYFYAHQPCIHGGWAEHAMFLPSARHFMQVDIPYLRKNGVGLCIVEETTTVPKWRQANFLTVSFTFPDSTLLPHKRYTVGVLR